MSTSYYAACLACNVKAEIATRFAATTRFHSNGRRDRDDEAALFVGEHVECVYNPDPIDDEIPAVTVSAPALVVVTENDPCLDGLMEIHHEDPAR